MIFGLRRGGRFQCHDHGGLLKLFRISSVLFPSLLLLDRADTQRCTHVQMLLYRGKLARTRYLVRLILGFARYGCCRCTIQLKGEKRRPYLYVYQPDVHPVHLFTYQNIQRTFYYKILVLPPAFFQIGRIFDTKRACTSSYTNEPAAAVMYSSYIAAPRVCLQL